MSSGTGLANHILPIAEGGGEGDHAKHGGGVIDEASSNYPSIDDPQAGRPRVVPLPKQAWGG
jgi:hypothetical protein